MVEVIKQSYLPIFEQKPYKLILLKRANLQLILLNNFS